MWRTKARGGEGARIENPRIWVMRLSGRGREKVQKIYYGRTSEKEETRTEALDDFMCKYRLFLEVVTMIPIHLPGDPPCCCTLEMSSRGLERSAEPADSCYPRTTKASRSQIYKLFRVILDTSYVVSGATSLRYHLFVALVWLVRLMMVCHDFRYRCMLATHATESLKAKKPCSSLLNVLVLALETLRNLQVYFPCFMAASFELWDESLCTGRRNAI